jgi:hypothetical protein
LITSSAKGTIQCINTPYSVVALGEIQREPANNGESK